MCFKENNYVRVLNDTSISIFYAARIKFKALMFSYKSTTGSAPLSAPKFITSDLCASRSLRSARERRFIVHPKEAQNHFHWILH